MDTALPGGVTPLLLELRRALSPDESLDGLGQLVLENVPGAFLAVYSQSGGLALYGFGRGIEDPHQAEHQFLGALAKASVEEERLYLATAAPDSCTIGITGYSLRLEGDNLVFEGLGEAGLSKHPFRLLPDHRPVYRLGGDHITSAFLSPGLCAQVAFESGLVPLFEELEQTAPSCKTTVITVNLGQAEDRAVGLLADPAGVCWYSPGLEGAPALRLTRLMGRAWLARGLARMAGQGGGSLWAPGRVPEGLEVRLVSHEVLRRYRLTGNASGLAWESLPSHPGLHSP